VFTGVEQRAGVRRGDPPGDQVHATGGTGDESIGDPAVGESILRIVRPHEATIRGGIGVGAGSKAVCPSGRVTRSARDDALVAAGDVLLTACDHAGSATRGVEKAPADGCYLPGRVAEPASDRPEVGLHDVGISTAADGSA
jgi:hypothetical protein